MPTEFFWGEGHRNPEDGAEDPIITEDLPERDTFPHAFDFGFGKRNIVFTQGKNSFGASYVCRGEVGQVGFGITTEKIEDIVFGWVTACHERRPSNRGNGRYRRFQYVVASLVGQFGEMGQLSFGHILIDENRIHPIQAENHDAVDMTFFVGFLAPD